MAKPQAIQVDHGDALPTHAPSTVVETPVPAPDDAPDPALAESRYWLRNFFTLLVLLCVALIAEDYHERGIAVIRGVLLVGVVVFGSVALMPARKLENVFLRPPSPPRLNAAPAEEPDDG